jgi:hypothetical protein
MKILSTISDSYKVDSQTSTTSPIGKRVSVVTGAESLSGAIPAVVEIGSMGKSDEYSEVALRARKLLMHQSLPSFEQRRSKVVDAVAMLAAGGEEESTKEAEELLADQIPIDDVLFPLLATVSSSGEEVGLIELYIRDLYRTYTMKKLERNQDERLIKFSFMNKQSESAISKNTSLSSMNDLTRIVSSSASLNRLGELAEKSESVSNLLAMDNKKNPSSH